MASGSNGLKQKAKCIRLNEDQFAVRLARNLAPPRQVGVWDVFLPILFIFSFVNGQRRRELLSANYMFTKEHAFDAAKRMASAGSTKEKALEPTRRTMDDLLSRVSSSVYSPDIAERQWAEIEFLVDHYHSLMQASGDDFPTLVRDVYPDADSYERFQTQLLDLERGVMQAARSTVGDTAPPEFIQRFDEMLVLLRNKERKRIYGDASDLMKAV